MGETGLVYTSLKIAFFAVFLLSAKLSYGTFPQVDKILQLIFKFTKNDQQKSVTFLVRLFILS